MTTGPIRGRSVDATVAIILVIAAVALFFHLSSTDVEFSRYNLQWNGTSVFFDSLDSRGTTAVGDLALLQGRRNATLLVIAPGREPTAEEGRAFRDFVTAGNTLVIADDFGSGNELLKAIGASARLNRGDLSSLGREFEISSAPIGLPVEGRPLVAGLSKIVFNHPVSVSGGSPVINSTYLSWIDEDRNRRPTVSEPMGRFTLATAESVGDGRVVVIGDASLFINAMQRLPECDNGLLLERLTAGETLVDQRLSQTSAAVGPISTFLWVKETPSLVVVVTALSLGVLAWSFNRRRR